MIEVELQGAVQDSAGALSACLQERFGRSLRAVLFYGSVLRGVSDQEGILDLMVIVDSYGQAHKNKLHACLNWMLPPNVYYLELPLSGRIIRSKYTVVSAAQMLRGTSSRSFQVYFWGRFAQPCRLVWARDDSSKEHVVRSLHQAASTFVRRCVPLMPGEFAASELWERGLEACYGTELRPERPGVAGRLVASDPPRFLQLTSCLLQESGWPVQEGSEPASFRVVLPWGARWRARQIWRLRRCHGKALNLLRLMKALLTFDGGLDYVAWKIERHSGTRVEISDLARRHPLLAGWRTLWRLYRRGAFR